MLYIIDFQHFSMKDFYSFYKEELFPRQIYSMRIQAYFRLSCISAISLNFTFSKLNIALPKLNFALPKLNFTKLSLDFTKLRSLVTMYNQHSYDPYIAQLHTPTLAIPFILSRLQKKSFILKHSISTTYSQYEGFDEKISNYKKHVTVLFTPNACYIYNQNASFVQMQ